MIRCVSKSSNHIVMSEFCAKMKFFICDLCGVKLQFKVDMIIHLKDHQNGSTKLQKKNVKKIVKGYPCHVCGKSFSRKESYTNHQLLHTGKSPHKCVVCGKLFTRDTNLQNHLKLHNQGSDANRIMAKFSCNFCTKTYTRKEYLISHMSIHTEESQHKCCHCQKMFTRKEHLIIHTRIHTGETPFKCQKCPKQFISKKSLKAHFDKHGMDKKSKNFICYICSKSFSRQSSVTNHINRTHSTGGSFQCRNCSKCFVVEQNLIFHMKAHKP